MKSASKLSKVPSPRRSAGPLQILTLILLAHQLAVCQQPSVNVAAIDRARILKAANQYLAEKPITITASSSPRSAGGLHDFFSEADYWWADPKDPNAPYIQRDGMSNPDNFVEHRRALMRLRVQVPALVAAWKLTKDNRYTAHAAEHLRAWFIDEGTRMNPNLQYATTQPRRLKQDCAGRRRDRSTKTL